MSVIEISRKSVKTRKRHLCHGCQNVFDKGDKMTSSTNIDDLGDGIWTLYYCEWCTAMIESRYLDDIADIDGDIYEGSVTTWMEYFVAEYRHYRREPGR